jgi:predicted TPR repeat methyltransferase
LRDGGFFCFSVEISQQQDFVLQPTRRYGHSASYLRALAQTHGFMVEAMSTQGVRNENEIDVPNYITVLRCV